MKFKITDASAPVYPDAEFKGTPIAELKSGDIVTIKEGEAGTNWVRIELSNGQIGFCRQPLRGNLESDMPGWASCLIILVALAGAVGAAIVIGSWYAKNLPSGAYPGLVLAIPAIVVLFAILLPGIVYGEKIASAIKKKNAKSK